MCTACKHRATRYKSCTQWMWGTPLQEEWNVANLQQACHDHDWEWWQFEQWWGGSNTPPSPLMEEQDAGREGPKDLPSAPPQQGVVLTDPPDGRMSLVVTNVHEHRGYWAASGCCRVVNMWHTDWLGCSRHSKASAKFLSNNMQQPFCVWKAPHKPQVLLHSKYM